MHIVVIPSWYPSSETDVDGIFFRLQAQALQREGMKIGMVVPMFRYLRSQPKTIFSRFYGLRRHQQGGLNTYAYDSMYFFPRCPVVDIDRIRWVNAGMKAFEAYITDNGKPDVIHAHCVNYAAILACAIFKKYGIPYVITEHSSAISRGLVRKTNGRPCTKPCATARPGLPSAVISAAFSKKPTPVQTGNTCPICWAAILNRISSSPKKQSRLHLLQRLPPAPPQRPRPAPACFCRSTQNLSAAQTQNRRRRRRRRPSETTGKRLGHQSRRYLYRRINHRPNPRPHAPQQRIRPRQPYRDLRCRLYRSTVARFARHRHTLRRP